jgi:hypothetical protein
MLSSIVSVEVKSADRISRLPRRGKAAGGLAFKRSGARLVFGLPFGGFPMARDLTSSELKDPFSRAMKRALEPPDVWTPRRILLLQIIGCAGLIYSVVCGGWSQRLGVALFFGSALTLAGSREAKRLWLRMERLEADVMLRDLGSRAQNVAGGDKPVEPVS